MPTDARTINWDTGEENLDPITGRAPFAPSPAAPSAASGIDAIRNAGNKTANINWDSDRTKGTGAEFDGVGAGAKGAYDAGSDASRAGFDTMHDLGNNDFFQDPTSILNRMGEQVGVSHVGDAAAPTFGVTNPLDFNPLDSVLDPNKGLGTTAGAAGGAVGGRPVTAQSPGTAAAAGVAGQGILPMAGDALDEALNGAGSIPIDASGADRGGMGLGGAYGGDLGRNRDIADAARATGAGVLGGSIAPGGAGAQGQTDVMGKALGFQPTAQQGVAGELGAFTKQGEGPSQAELLLSKAAEGNMADALSLARSGRARDAGSMARALNVAQGENAATGIEAGRDAATLRAQEAQTFRNQQLQALQQKGALAQGVDQTGLQALGLGGDLATQLRSGNISERGQNLGFAQGMEGIGAGLDSDVLKAIPQLEQVRHSDQFELTPQQKLAAAKLGGAPDKTTADYVTGLLGDVLSAL